MVTISSRNGSTSCFCLSARDVSTRTSYLPTSSLTRSVILVTDSAMVKLDNPGDWTIRTANPLPNQFIAGYSVLSYTSNARSTCGEPINGLPALCGNQVFTSPPSNQPKMGFAANLLDGAILHDQFTMKPYPPTAPPSTVDHTIIWDMAQEVERIWSIDHQALLPWREQDVPAIVDYQPLLDANVATWFDNGSVVDIVFNVPAGQPPHVSLSRRYLGSEISLNTSNDRSAAVSQAREQGLGVRRSDHTFASVALM